MGGFGRIVSLVLFGALSTVAFGITWDFEDPGQFDAWSPVNGDWAIEKGVLVNAFDAIPAKRILVGEEDWTDYTIEVKIRIDQHNWAGVVFRAVSDFEYYVAYLNVPDNKSELWRHKQGAHDARDAINSNFPAQGGVKIVNNEWIDAKLVVEGDVFTFFLNGEEQWEATDGVYKQGRVGVWTWASAASFDDFTVNGPGIPASLSVEPAGKLAVRWAALKRP